MAPHRIRLCWIAWMATPPYGSVQEAWLTHRQYLIFARLRDTISLSDAYAYATRQGKSPREEVSVTDSVLKDGAPSTDKLVVMNAAATKQSGKEAQGQLPLLA